MRTAFLSSTGKDLAECRKAVFEAINDLDSWKCARMENFGARTRTIRAFDTLAVRNCNLFIGIIGHRYGSNPPVTQKSYTELEYDEAVKQRKPRLMFLAADNFPIPADLVEDDGHRRRQ